MFYFNGRPDGIGNRIEELIYLERYCELNDETCSYFWNNQGARVGRRYPILVTCKHIHIQDQEKYDYNVVKTISMASLKNNMEHSRDDLVRAARNVTYKDPIVLVDGERDFVSVHLRATDKLLNRGDHEFTKSLFESNFLKCVDFVNQMSETNINVCSDDSNQKRLFISKLVGKKIVDPLKTRVPHEEYKDFFNLVFSKKIIMCPKYSSYSATASLMGDNAIGVFFEPTNDPFVKRYGMKIFKFIK